MHNIALIGAGRIGHIHAANAAAHSALALTRVVDPVAEAAEEVAAAYGLAVSDLDDVLGDPAIAGVVIASSTDTHLDYATRALSAGKAVFCEKPIDLDPARARAAADVLGAKDARLLLAFNRRFDPHFRAFKDQLDAGEIGNLETLHIISHDPAPPPVAYIKVSGGLFKDMTIHDFDMARWLLAEEPSEVFASASCLVDPGIGAAGDVDTAKVILTTPSGRIAVISNTRRSGYGYDQRLEAYGSGGALRVGNVTETRVERWAADGATADSFQNFFLDRYRDAYRNEMDHFVDVLSGAVRPQVGYHDGVRALDLAEAAAASAASGAAIKL